MNEYSRGVLEALSWALDQIDELDDGNNGAMRELRRRIRALIEQVVRGACLSLHYQFNGIEV